MTKLILFILTLGSLGGCASYGYKGEYKGDAPHGQGTFTWRDGKYEGQFKDGKYHGQGTMTIKNLKRKEEYVYSGSMIVMDNSHNPIMREVTYSTLKSGEKYVGQWKDGLPHGQGIKYDSKGKVLRQGIFSYGAYIGQYVGQLEDGMPHGQGTMTYANGSKYVGQWQNHEYYGEGTFYNSNGNYEEGHWRYGKKHGLITFYDSDSKVIEKNFFLNGNICQYEGQVINGVPHGKGTITYPNGSKYVGQWKDGKMHGEGISYGTNGNVYAKGTWQEGEFVGNASDEKPKAQLGALIGSIGGFEGGDVVVNGRDTIGKQAPIGSALIVDANGQYVYLQSTFPMQTVVKCKVTSGERSLIKKGMKVYLKQ